MVPENLSQRGLQESEGTGIGFLFNFLFQVGGLFPKQGLR